MTPSLRILAGSDNPGESGTKLLDRASAFTSLEPGRAAGPRKDAVAQIQHWNIDKEQGRQTQVELNSKAANELTKTPEGGSPETAIPLVTTEVNSATEFTTPVTLSHFEMAQWIAKINLKNITRVFRYKKKEDEGYLLLDVHHNISTEGTLLKGTENLQSDHIFKEAQVAASTWEKGKSNKKTISAIRGTEVILVVDAIGESEIQDIQWIKNGINFATTQPSERVTVRDTSYDGRLGSSSDGSLIIYKFEMEDQGEYKADILMKDLKKDEIVFVLNISEGDSHRNNRVAVIVPVIVWLVVIAAGVAFMLWRKKRCPANSREIPVEEAKSDPEGKSELEKEERKELKGLCHLNLEGRIFSHGGGVFVLLEGEPSAKTEVQYEEMKRFSSGILGRIPISFNDNQPSCPCS
ncbi:unnamed protein product [Ranitomeya imitator]|uniref:Uncharacterized protein n=1 Tax=Ranitomeya imitator TaxID=111125 RepID=A0ABN9MQ04_9NEOB|nr:unnamed protein product [Ranitomeya imitator]